MKNWKKVGPDDTNKDYMIQRYVSTNPTSKITLIETWTDTCQFMKIDFADNQDALFKKFADLDFMLHPCSGAKYVVPRHWSMGGQPLTTDKVKFFEMLMKEEPLVKEVICNMADYEVRRLCNGHGYGSLSAFINGIAQEPIILKAYFDRPKAPDLHEEKPTEQPTQTVKGLRLE